ncbi:MAG: hypothetical protein ACQCXQ_04150 [Verrucomicrobiales bacterium]|nr:hypothetical protein [Verrucomicrobiota bacterium JB025]
MLRKPTVAPLLLSGLLGTASAADVHTILHPDEAHPIDQTVIWSPLFQAGWDALNRPLGGPPQRIDPPNPLMTRLDTFSWQADSVMPDGSWNVWAGPATNALVNQANEQASKLGAPAGCFTLGAESPHALASFGYLNHTVRFDPHLYPSKKHGMQFRSPGKTKNVAFFGVRGPLTDRFSKTISVLSWLPDSQTMTIDLAGKSAGNSAAYHVILHATGKPATIATASRTVKSLLETPAIDATGDEHFGDALQHLHPTDDLRIPFITLEANASCEQRLQGGRIHGHPGDPWRIVKAQQLTTFMLDEKGARIAIRTASEFEPFGDKPPIRTFPKPRKFHFDRPFFVFLWKQGADWPFFAAWLGDDSCMRPFHTGNIRSQPPAHPPAG